MMPTKNVGAPSPVNRQVSKEGSANHLYPSADITLSQVILRALENRPQNEDRIRGVL